MAQIIGLPKLSPTMEEGVLVKWIKKEGEQVEPGDLVAEVETDKANMDFNLEDEGVLLKILVQEGETVKLGAPVAILGEEGENIEALVAEASGGGASSGSAPVPDMPKAKVAPTKAGAATHAAPPTQPEMDNKRATPSAASAKPQGSGASLLASPLAKSLALSNGLDLRSIAGSGPGGRIIERDVRALLDGGVQDLKSKTPPPQSQALDSTALAVIPRGALAKPSLDNSYEDKEVTKMRRTIAERLTAAKRDIPHFRLTTSFDAQPLLDYRKRLNELLKDRGKVTVNDLLIKGCALALRRVPEVNAAYLGDVIRYYTGVHVGVAVALERGLLTPVIRNADLKGIGVIGAEVKDLVGRAKERRIKADEIQGSTFTISNLGMFGVDHFDAIINPPEGAILAVGRTKKVPVFKDDDTLVMGQRMTLTMSCDHRVIDGAVGAKFLDVLTSILEQPESLAL